MVFLQLLMRTAKFPLLAMHGVLQEPVKFMKRKYMASLYAYGGGYNAWPPRCDVSRERSTLRVPLSSFLPCKKRLRNSYFCNSTIGFDNSHCMWKFVVYRGLPGCNIISTLPQRYPWSQSMRPIPDGVSATSGSIHMTNPIPLKLFFPVEMWDHILPYSLDAP